MSAVLDIRAFDFIDSFVSTPLAKRDGMKLVHFCETVFPQFYTNALGGELTSFDDVAKRQVLQRLSRGDVDSSEVRALAASLLDFCDMHSQITVDIVYGLLDSDDPKTPARVFRDRFMVRLLERIDAWAVSRHSRLLSDRATKTRMAYVHALSAES